jgi:hypothetical protein
MGKKITVSVKALVIGGLCVFLIGFAVIRQVRVEKAYATAFESIGSYIGACQKAGLLPTPQALQERLAQIEAQAQAKEAVKK